VLQDRIDARETQGNGWAFEESRDDRLALVLALPLALGGACSVSPQYGTTAERQVGSMQGQVGKCRVPRRGICDGSLCNLDDEFLGRRLTAAAG
jgi:hypothetical protein